MTGNKGESPDQDNSPEADSRFHLDVDLSTTRFGIPVVSALSLSFAAIRKGAQISPETHGVVHPELIHSGSGPNLLAAAAIGINSVLGNRDIVGIYEELKEANNDVVPTNVSPSEVNRKIELLSQFKLDFLRQVKFTPLRQDARNASSFNLPMPRLFDSLRSGASVLFPFPKGYIRGASKSRHAWGVITGYEELSGDQIRAGARRDEDETEFSTYFAVAVPLRDERILRRMTYLEVADVLDEGEGAIVIRPAVKRA